MHMADKTGHAGKPGAGPFDAQCLCTHGVVSGYYTYQDPSTREFEAVKMSPNGIPDETAAGGFTTRQAAAIWIEESHKH
jgi:hypothetical protein